MKIELKHLAPYLPYGVKCRWARRLGDKKNDAVLTIADYGFLTNKTYFKPILRPLSDLTKPITTNSISYLEHLTVITMNGKWRDEIGEKGIQAVESDLYRTGKCNLKVYHQLIEWHFDVFNLIEQGLAIDINFLNQ